MKPLVSEIRAVVAVLELQHMTAEAAAEAAIEALDQARIERTLFGVAIQGTPCAFVYQPFESKQKALQWIKKNAVGVEGSGLHVGVIPLLSKELPPRRQAKAKEELDEKKELLVLDSSASRKISSRYRSSQPKPAAVR